MREFPALHAQNKNQTEGKAKVVAWGMELVQFHAALAIQRHDDLKKRINRRTDTCQNGCLGKLDDHPVHPPKMAVLPKAFLQIIHASKQLVKWICQSKTKNYSSTTYSRPLKTETGKSLKGSVSQEMHRVLYMRCCFRHKQCIRDWYFHLQDPHIQYLNEILCS